MTSLKLLDLERRWSLLSTRLARAKKKLDEAEQAYERVFKEYKRAKLDLEIAKQKEVKS